MSDQATFHALADRALHLKSQQAIHLDGKFHREFFDDGFDESADDHRRCFGIGETARGQVKELLFADLADGCLMADSHIIFLNINVRIGVGTRLIVEQERVALNFGF